MLRRICSYLLLVSVALFAGTVSATTFYTFSPSIYSSLPFNLSAMVTSQHGDDTYVALSGSFADIGSNAYTQGLFFNRPGRNSLANAMYSSLVLTGADYSFNWNIRFPAGGHGNSSPFIAMDNTGWRFANIQTNFYIYAQSPIFINFYLFTGLDPSLLIGLTSAPVPEPQSWLLLFAGAGLMGWRLRRRSQH